jgi:hypothetical protein
MSFDYPTSPAPQGPKPRTVFFERRELDRILRLYGRMVASGDWRDYAIGSGDGSVVFAVFKRTGEAPLYRIEKTPALARRQGAWSVVSQNGMILKRGHELEQVLAVFDNRKFRVVE